MAIYYIEHENGSFLSSNGVRRFIRLSGKEAYAYLKTEEGRSKRFVRTSSCEDGGEEEFVEIPTSHVSQHRKGERRVQYVSDCIENSGFVTISLYAMEDDEGSDLSSGEDLISNPSSDVEAQVLHEISLEILRSALKALTDEERKLVHALYLSERRCSERKLAEIMGISQVAVHKRKNAVLEKLRNFF